MQTVKIKTSQNIDIDYEVASLGDRVLARIVDMGVILGVTYIIYTIGIIAFISNTKIFTGNNGIPTVFIVIGIIYSLVIIFYDLITEIFYNGKSVGKFALKIKVVSLSGARPTTGQFLLRWVFRLVDFVITGGIGALISVAVSEKKQRIGDIVAGTTLIKTKPKTELSDLYFTSPEEDYEPLFAGVSDLKDSDITVIHEVISNFKRTRNSELVYNMALRAKEVLGVEIPAGMNDFEFLNAIVRDYSYVTSRMPA